MMDFVLTVEVGCVCVCTTLCYCVVCQNQSQHDFVLLCPNPYNPLLSGPN
jgi:hypothetical protein